MRLSVQSFAHNFDPKDPNINEKLTEFSDQIFLAEAFLVDAQDAENAAAVYEEAELNALSNDALSQLGTSVSGRLGDAKWASRILGKIR